MGLQLPYTSLVAALMKASAREKAETFTTGARFYPRNDTDASQTAKSS
jgi:hypothetical protein